MLQDAFNAQKNGYIKASYSYRSFKREELFELNAKSLNFIAENPSLKGQKLSNALKEQRLSPTNITLKNGSTLPAIRDYGRDIKTGEDTILREVRYMTNGTLLDPEKGIPALQIIDPTDHSQKLLITAKSHPIEGAAFQLNQEQINQFYKTGDYEVSQETPVINMRFDHKIAEVH